MHAAGYGCTVRLLRRLVELGGDVRLHDFNGLMVRHWAARQLNVSRRSKNLSYLLYAQNRSLDVVGRPPISVQASSPVPTVAVRQRASQTSSTTCVSESDIHSPDGVVPDDAKRAAVGQFRVRMVPDTSQDGLLYGLVLISPRPPRCIAMEGQPSEVRYRGEKV